MKNNNCKKFRYKNFDNCYFIVSSYLAQKEAMAIQIEKDGEPIATCTVFEFGLPYSEHVTVIKNYSENSHMTNFLKKLGIVKEILYRNPCNSFVTETLTGNNPQTFDTCLIDTDKLKEYCKIWNYNV